MKYLILVTDIVFRFRIVAIELNIAKPNTWERRVMTIQEVTALLLSLHCIDPAAARFLDGGQRSFPTPAYGLFRSPRPFPSSRWLTLSLSRSALKHRTHS